MLSVDASAAAIALVNDPPASSSAALPPDKNLLVHVGDRFIGRYTCTQGPTDLTIRLESIGRGEGEIEVEATIEFNYDGSTGHTAAEGSYHASGNFDPRTRRLQLRGDRWIDQPTNYSMVKFVGALSKRGDTYSGSVDTAGCSSFTTSVERDEEEH